MDVESLRCFLAAAELLSFRAAAQHVGLLPAAFGKRIAGLELELGAPLFSRTSRRVALTPAGAALLSPARATVAASEDCLRAARGELEPAPQTLTLGTRLELGRSWILPLLPALEAAQRGLRIDLFVSSGPDLERLVRLGELDLAISSRPVSDPAVRGHRLHEERYVLAGDATLLGARPVASLADLRAHTLLDVSPEHDLLRYWQAARPSDVELPWGGVRYLGSLALILDLVRAGQGLAVLPAYAIAGDLAVGALAPVLPGLDARSDWFRLLHRRGDPRAPLFQALLATLREAPLR